MFTRRKLMITAGALAASAPSLAVAATGQTTLGDDGLHKQPWMLDTFLEMGDDLQAAADNGRNLMVLVEQQGCPYCRELHNVNFARTEITDYIQAHFDVIQLDLFGAREVLDFDGEALEERALVDKWAVSFTPTTLLFHGQAAGAKSRAEAESFRMPGYLKPFHYLSALEFVQTGQFRDQGFQRFLQDKFEDFRARGIDPDVW